MSIVIKASGPIHASESTAFNFNDIGDRAQQYVDQISRQAADTLTKANQEAKLIRQRAEEQGKEQGKTAALEAAKKILSEKVGQQLTSLLPALQEAINHIHAAKALWMSHWEKTAIHVATSIASLLIRRELERQPEITLSLVKEALELAAGSGDIQLRMHPDDLAALGEHVQRLTEELTRLGAPQIVSDPQISKGSCRVDTRFGMIDQQWAAQLARIEQELT